ncbi:hypothetical protein F2Q69_00030021 [Brassica cretica]|uniref:Uncharacterized protein n=1 Tax=Brassica cretica TaxID=69181 RepID=A0A8S9SB13_BRACR|nr:hypothetical protein F2Q69_00030021 [Brassica cretica]
MQRRDETDQKEHVSAIRSIERAVHRSISILQRRSTSTIQHQSTSVQNQKPLDLDGYAKAINGRTLHLSREDIADILQTANGADNLFMQQQNIPEHQEKVTKEFYDTTGGIENRFKQKSRYPTRPSIDWEEKDEYGIYRDDQGYARDIDGHTICVHNNDIRRILERASRDEPNYICLPGHASSFTQTKLVPEIYTKDEINEMFYGVCGEQEKKKGDFQMKLVVSTIH